MSVNLEFYAVAWTDVSAAIGCRNRRLFSTILKKTDSYFEEVFDPEDFDDGPDFEVGLERWIDGDVDAPEDGEPTTIVNLGDALGFVALVRFHGQLVGSLNHSISAGDRFRQGFLLGAAQRLVHAPFSLEQLLSRPVVGYESDDFPFWGGLKRAELGQLREAVTKDVPSWEADSDIDEWLLDLWNSLRGSMEAGRDLITIYS